MPSPLGGHSPRHPAELDVPIAAVASPAGPGLRAVVRLSGLGVWEIVRSCQAIPLAPTELPRRRERVDLKICLPGWDRPLPVQALIWPGPRSYTGQDMIELQLISSPPLVDHLLTYLQAKGARLAKPGEFTLRAFLAGKLDLTQAEAVRAVVDAVEPEELHAALDQLAGGVSTPLHSLRARLLHVLAEVEAGLDFAEEDLSLMSRAELLPAIQETEAEVLRIRDQLGLRTLAGRAFRVALAGQPNVGKSSLFNALVGRHAALVSPQAGTTRDYLIEHLEHDGIQIDLLDTAGIVAAPPVDSDSSEDSIDRRAQAAGTEQVRTADLVLLCSEAGGVSAEGEPVFTGVDVVRVITKADLLDQPRQPPRPPDAILTSAVTGQGVDELCEAIASRARQASRRSALTWSASRARAHLESCAEHLLRSRTLVERGESPELLALELRLGLDQVGELVGEVFTDDLLDQVFSQFCIGK